MADADTLVVACAQVASVRDPAENLEKCLAIARDAAARGVQLLVFPESASSRSDDVGVPPVHEPLDGPFLDGFLRGLTSTDMTVVLGLTETTADARPYNTAVAVRAGKTIAAYRKIHLYDAAGFRESASIRPGDGPLTTFDVGGFRVGMMTCYDIRFPEVGRLLAERGADLIAVPTSWVRGPLKEQHWSTLCASRAIENTVYIAGAAQTSGTRIGRSMLVAPDGIVQASLGFEEDLLVTSISRTRLTQVRDAFPLLAQRRLMTSGTPSAHPAASGNES